MKNTGARKVAIRLVQKIYRLLEQDSSAAWPTRLPVRRFIQRNAGSAQRQMRSHGHRCMDTHTSAVAIKQMPGQPGRGRIR